MADAFLMYAPLGDSGLSVVSNQTFVGTSTSINVITIPLTTVVNPNKCIVLVSGKRDDANNWDKQGYISSYTLTSSSIQINITFDGSGTNIYSYAVQIVEIDGFKSIQRGLSLLNKTPVASVNRSKSLIFVSPLMRGLGRAGYAGYVSGIRTYLDPVEDFIYAVSTSGNSASANVGSWNVVELN